MQLYKSALAALALGTMAVGGCSSEESTPEAKHGNSETAGLGEVGMALLLPDDSEVTNVNFTITGPGGYNRSGVVPVGNSSKLTFRVGNLPLGNGYTISLSANTSFGEPCAGGPTMFNVLDNLTTTVAVSLQCQATDNRADLIVNGAFESCPLVTSLEAIPAETYVNGSMALAALISHGDSAVSWTATGGTFSSASSLAPYITTYTCPATEGVYTITGTVTGAGAACNDDLTMTVECTRNPGCGNGSVDPGETCDDGPLNSDTAACKTNCQPNVCGDGAVHAGVEECDAVGLPTATCTATCEAIVCGDNVINAPETCDDGNTVPNDGCSATCRIEGCGDGVVNGTEQCDLGAANSNTGACTLACQNAACGDTFVQPGEQCEPPNTATCSATCQNLVVVPYGDDAHQIASCLACRGDGRVGTPPGACSDIGGFGMFDAPALCFNNADSAFVQQCIDLRNCIDTSNIGYGAVGPIESFCGTAPLSTCSVSAPGATGGANGPCIDEWWAACRTSDLTTLTGSIGDLSLPCGIANAITECDVQFCPTCITP